MVVLSARAKIEAISASRWLHGRSPTAAARWLAGLNQAITSLDLSPGRHPVSEEASRHFGSEVREMLYKRRRRAYLIYFSVDGAVVTVLAIRHGAPGPIEP